MAEDQPQTVDSRVSVRMRVRISTIDPETDPWTGKTFYRTSEETCANVSKGGAFVETSETIPPGRRVLLELEIPGGQQVETVGRIVWAKRAGVKPAGGNTTAAASGVGVEFSGGPRDQRLALERFLDRSVRRRRLASHAHSLTPPESR